MALPDGRARGAEGAIHLVGAREGEAALPSRSSRLQPRVVHGEEGGRQRLVNGGTRGVLLDEGEAGACCPSNGRETMLPSAIATAPSTTSSSFAASTAGGSGSGGGGGGGGGDVLILLSVKSTAEKSRSSMTPSAGSLAVHIAGSGSV